MASMQWNPLDLAQTINILLTLISTNKEPIKCEELKSLHIKLY